MAIVNLMVFKIAWGVSGCHGNGSRVHFGCLSPHILLVNPRSFMVKSTRIRLVYPCQYPIKVNFSFGSVKNIYIFINSYVPHKIHKYFPCICFPPKSPVFTDVSFPTFSGSDNSECQDASPNSYNDPPHEPGSPFCWAPQPVG